MSSIKTTLFLGCHIDNTNTNKLNSLPTTKRLNHNNIQLLSSQSLKWHWPPTFLPDLGTLKVTNVMVADHNSQLWAKLTVTSTKLLALLLPINLSHFSSLYVWKICDTLLFDLFLIINILEIRQLKQSWVCTCWIMGIYCSINPPHHTFSHSCTHSLYHAILLHFTDTYIHTHTQTVGINYNCFKMFCLLINICMILSHLCLSKALFISTKHMTTALLNL